MSPEELQAALEKMGPGLRLVLDDYTLVVSYINVLDGGKTLEVFPAEDADDDRPPYYVEGITKVSEVSNGLEFDVSTRVVARVFPLGEVAPEVKIRISSRTPEETP